MKLFKYPFITGSTAFASCLANIDSGVVTDILPTTVIRSQTFNNAARSLHTTTAGVTTYNYNDCFYINDAYGPIKMVFNHPQDSVHRVLELVRSHFVRNVLL